MIYSALQTLKEHLLLNHVCFTHPTEDISTIRIDDCWYSEKKIVEFGSLDNLYSLQFLN